MWGVALVGGEGTRLRPLTCNTVKAMVPILNRPFLEHFIGYLRRHQVEDIVLALCYLPQQIESYFGDGGNFGVRLKYTVEDPPLGTAGAVKNAEMYLKDAFFVFNGDVFTDIDLGAMLSFHRQKKAKVSIALTPVEDTSLYGVVETDTQGRVRRFIEKPPREEATTNLINAGIYIIDPEVLHGVPPDTHFMFEHHLFPSLLEDEVPIYGYPSEAYWLDIGTLGKYLQLHYDLLSSGAREVEVQCLIHPTAQIEGSVRVGSYCIIEPRAWIKGSTAIGSGCRVGEQAVITGSVLWRNVQVGQRAELKGCIVGDNTFIGDDCFVSQGSVLGDNVIMMAGSRVPPNSTVWPGTIIEAER